MKFKNLNPKNLSKITFFKWINNLEFKILIFISKIMVYKGVMDKEHLIDLISNSLLYESKDFNSKKNLSKFKDYLMGLNLEQLRTMSKEFIL